MVSYKMKPQKPMNGRKQISRVLRKRQVPTKGTCHKRRNPRDSPALQTPQVVKMTICGKCALEKESSLLWMW